jgi:hypothetical protein
MKIPTALLLCACLAACGSGSKSDSDVGDAPDDTLDVAGEDVSSDVPAETDDPDAADDPDVLEDPPDDVEADGAGCTETFADLDLWEEECYVISEGWDYLATIEGTIDSVPYSYIVIELWPTEGGPSTPGTYSFTDDNYDACGLCSVVRMDCEVDCAPVYLLTSGTIQVDSVDDVGGTFAGRIVSAAGIEVTIDISTYHSTPVEGGGTICLEDVRFSTEVMDF